MKTIGIIGIRERNREEDHQAVCDAFDEIYEKGDRICSGGCPKGGDQFAHEIARHTGIPILIFYPNWKRYGKGAGFVRNGLIARESNVLIACVSKNRTGGTEDTITKFEKRHPGVKAILA